MRRIGILEHRYGGLGGSCGGVSRLARWTHVSFDFDDTLASTGELHEQSFLKVLRPFGLDKSFDYAEVRGRKTEDVFTQLGFADALVTDLATRKREIYENLVIRSLASPIGVHDFLNLGRIYGLRFSIVSNGSNRSVNNALTVLRIKNLFDAVVTADDVSEPKPSPEGLQLVLSRCGVDARSLLFVDDSPVGLDAAAAAGVDCVSVGFADRRAITSVKTFEEFGSWFWGEWS